MKIINKIRNSKETTNKSQREIYKLKNTMTELSIFMESFNSRLDQAEERIYKFEEKPFEMAQTEENRNGND
jgi:proteasome assembly chaperone (PAC2) family protein